MALSRKETSRRERSGQERDEGPRTKERLMTYEERDKYLEMLSRGASPLGSVARWNCRRGRSLGR